VDQKPAVRKILTGKNRQEQAAWVSFRSHFLWGPSACMRPVMAVAGQRRRTCHSGPLTLEVSLRPRRDNRGNFTPMDVGTRGSHIEADSRESMRKQDLKEAPQVVSFPLY